jgi:hypothetical protein
VKIAAPATVVRAPAVMSTSVARPAFFVPNAGELVSARVEHKRKVSRLISSQQHPSSWGFMLVSRKPPQVGRSSPLVNRVAGEPPHHVYCRAWVRLWVGASARAPYSNI